MGFEDLGIQIGPTRFGAGGHLRIKGYYQGGGIALEVVSDRGPEYVATVNLADDQQLPNGEVWLKGWSGNEGVPEALQAAGAVRLTGRTCETGHVFAEHAELLFDVPQPAATTDETDERPF